MQTFLEFKIDIPKPKETLGITRDKMPQIASKNYDEFINYLRKNDVKMTRRKVPAKRLKPIQKEFSKGGIEKSMIRSIGGGVNNPLITSSDFYIIDGHHRWLATKNINPNDKIEVYQANITVQDLLALTLGFSKVTFKGIYK
jgi:uncharacterized protein (DUF1015 family)